MMVHERPLRQVDTPLAKELAEYILIQKDLQGAIAAMTLWHESYAEQPVDTPQRLIGTSLFRDSIVQFVACFDPSSSHPLSAEEIYGHDPKGVSSFQWFKDIRDSYAAHRFGAFRQCTTGVIQNPITGLVAGVGHIAAAYKGQNKADGPILTGFMQTALNFVDTKVQHLTFSFQAEASALTKEQIETLPIAQVRPIIQEESRVSRESFRRALATGQPPTKRRGQ